MKLKTAKRFLSRNGHKLAEVNEPRKALVKRARIARKVINKAEGKPC